MRACWHGYPSDYDTFINLTATNRYLAIKALNQIIENSNERGSGKPTDERR